jgi:hypothetical protein
MLQYLKIKHKIIKLKDIIYVVVWRRKYCIKNYQKLKILILDGLICLGIKIREVIVQFSGKYLILSKCNNLWFKNIKLG